MNPFIHEFREAATRLEHQLLDSGVPAAHAIACTVLYLDTLRAPNDLSWARFYRTLALHLAEAAERAPLPARARALLQLLDDDFGSRAIETPLRERIMRGFVERTLREASLSS